MPGGYRWAAATLSLAACIVTGLPEIQDDDVDRARAVFPSASRERMEEGRRTFGLRCGACHQAYDPRQRDAEEWRKMVAEMAPRAGLDAERRAKVLEYLVAFAK